MSKWFRLSRKCLLMGVVCGLGMLALAGGPVRAGTLEILIQEGATSFDILDNGPLDTNPATNAITALASALVFPDFTVIGLNAFTNNPGAENPTGAVLTVGGEIQRTTGGAAASISITVTDTDYNLPSNGKTLGSAASGVFTNVPAGDTQNFTSWFNPSNTPLAKDLSSGALNFLSVGGGQQHFSNGTPLVPVGSAVTYGLTNETVLTMGGASAGTTPDILFNGSTQVLTIPEPTSLAIMLPALPVVIMGWLRHRKARATSAS
jgi:hypothetical protein